MLIFFNIIFWLSGCAILGIGIWLTVDSCILYQVLDETDPVLQYAAYILIAMGCFVFIVGFLGCCGAIKESKCMLGMYIVFLLIIMAGELAAGILTLVYKDEVLKTATDTLVTKLQKDDIYTKEDGEDKIKFTAFGLSMSLTQVELKCCGINGSTDYADSTFAKDNAPQPFPFTCCVMKEGTTLEESMNPEESVADWNKCYAMDKEFFHDQGCKDGLEDLFTSNALVLIGIGIGIACLELIGIIIACILMRNLGEEV